jgi:protein TonB
MLSRSVFAVMALGLAAPASAMQSASAPPGPEAPPAQAQPSSPSRDAAPSPKPSLADLYPAEAKAKKLSGRTRMRCRVDADRTLSQCVVIHECPAGLGFGKAALEAARFFKARPESVAGQPAAGGTVVVPITWKLQGGGALPPQCQ